jgi:uncharacterized protein (TIGR03437 family)
MKSWKPLAILGLLASAGVWAQGVSQITIGTSVPGPNFMVDGTTYTQTQVFVWPTGSKHTVQFLFSVDPTTGLTLGYQDTSGDTMRFTFSGWITNTGSLTQTNQAILSITASPDLTSIIANITISYRMHITFWLSPGLATCSGTPGDAPQDGWRYGVVYVDGACLTTDTDIFLSAGPHQLNAFAFPGFVFANWYIDGNAPNGAFYSYNMTHAVTVVPNFQPAKRVRFRTNPSNLTMLVDHELVNAAPGLPPNQLPASNSTASCSPNYASIPGGAPSGFTPLCYGDFDFLPGSAHQIGAPQSQRDIYGKLWVFGSFSDGLGQNGTYMADYNTGTPDTVIANFVPGAYISFLTNPPGLGLQVDGRINWPGYTFIWGQGETHTVSAPATQADSKGRKYNFMGWSNKGPATQTLVVPSDGSQINMTANYQALGQVQITSNPPGLTLTADGSNCVTPCSLDRAAGTTIQVTAPVTVPNTQLSRLDFDGFSGAGSGGASVSVTFTTDVLSLNASYHTSWSLLTASNPANQAQFRTSPSSPDGYFADGTQVSITVVPSAGYRFTSWGGDLNGVFTTAYLTMNAPHSITASLAASPYIPPAGIVTAAGANPGGTIGPGSIISIFGQNLAPALQIGQTNPLSQAIGGITVTVGNYLLPLMFVSPQQINAQVPVELADGNYTLAVHQAGQPDVTGAFTVQRDSPGVFTQANANGAPLVLALHADGTPVTPDSPAQRNETISIYGTGFGPLDHTPVDGFVVAPGSGWLLTDPVAVVTDSGLSLTPSWAGAAEGMVGTAVVKVNISDQVPTATTLKMQVTVNGVQSNSVQLPVQ